MNKRYIFAIDPGTVESAYVFWDSYKKIILARGIVKNEDLLTIIWDTNFDVMAIEMVASYGMSVGKEVFETCLWIGRFMQASPYPVERVYRREVKMFLCGNMRAKDGNIRQALLDMLGKEVTKGVSKDVWSALAVAVAFADKALDKAKSGGRL
jgi:Holliday junction resolvasome RuvABC endonuclease subunit